MRFLCASKIWSSKPARPLQIRRMSENLPSFKEGGLFWFTDLSGADPTYLLPAICAATFLVTVEVSTPRLCPPRTATTLGGSNPGRAGRLYSPTAAYGLMLRMGRPSKARVLYLLPSRDRVFP